jgi:hypothetical protein
VDAEANTQMEGQIANGQDPAAPQIYAQEFLIGKITGQANRTAVPLSEVELRMLRLNLSRPESAVGIPVEALQDADQIYEKKLSMLLQAAYSHDGAVPKEQDKYRNAIQELKGSDHYLLIVAADAIPKRKSIATYAVYIIIALVMIGMIAILQFWTQK